MKSRMRETLTSENSPLSHRLGGHLEICRKLAEDPFRQGPLRSQRYRLSYRTDCGQPPRVEFPAIDFRLQPGLW